MFMLGLATGFWVAEAGDGPAPPPGAPVGERGVPVRRDRMPAAVHPRPDGNAANEAGKTRGNEALDAPARPRAVPPDPAPPLAAAPPAADPAEETAGSTAALLPPAVVADARAPHRGAAVPPGRAPRPDGAPPRAADAGRGAGFGRAQAGTPLDSDSGAPAPDPVLEQISQELNKRDEHFSLELIDRVEDSRAEGYQDSEQLAAEVAEVLGDLGDEEAAPWLREELDGVDLSTGSSAEYATILVQALARIGETSGLSAIRRFVERHESRPALAAAHADLLAEARVLHVDARHTPAGDHEAQGSLEP